MTEGRFLPENLSRFSMKVQKKTESFADGVGRGLHLAVRSTRKTARLYSTPIYVWANGKIVAKKP
jgi:hypothetical protein